MHPLRRFLRFFFWHFYHDFAWSYDLVAMVVSIGRWNDWIRSVIPFVRGRRVLELGHGPGHLQVYLREQRNVTAFGLDESAQMGLMAKERLRQAAYRDGALTRGLGQALPFANGSFDTVVSTFPTEYIFEPVTLQEVRRVLTEGGRFVVLPAAWIVGRKILDRAAAWLFRSTDQAPHFRAEVMSERLQGPFEEAGFATQFQTIELRSSELLVIIGERQTGSFEREPNGSKATRAS